MFNMNTIGFTVVVSTLTVAIGVPARAASFTNGDFGTGDFTGWNTAGFTYVNSPRNYYPLPVNTLNEAQIVTFGSETFYNDPARDISPSSLETRLGMSSGSLESQNSNFDSGSQVLSGSGISQAVNLRAGDRVSFDYNFLTNETPGSKEYDDFAFFQANSTNYTSSLKLVASVANSSFNQTTTAPDFLYDTGFKTYSFTVPVAGTYTISVGATNVGGSTGGDSDSFPSAILASNFKVAAVPEPSFAPGALSLFAGGAIVCCRRRKQKQHS